MRFLADAIVIRRGPFSETSQVADLLTASEGRITTLVLGAHRAKSVFGGPLDLLTRGVADVRRRKNTELDVLQTFRITHPYRGLRSTSLRFSAACHALELIRAFAWPRDLETELFRLLTGFLDALDASAESAVLDAWLLTLPGALLRAAGLQPRLEACVACTRPVPDAASARLSFAEGGIVCAVCAPRDAHAIVLSPGVRGLLARSVHGAPRQRAGAAETPGMADVVQARRVLDLYLEHRLERPLLARRLLERCLAEAAR